MRLILCKRTKNCSTFYHVLFKYRHYNLLILFYFAHTTKLFFIPPPANSLPLHPKSWGSWYFGCAAACRYPPIVPAFGCICPGRAHPPLLFSFQGEGACLSCHPGQPRDGIGCR